MRASDLFMRCLEAEGVEYVFGVPGEENADLLMSMRESSVRFVPTHHETGGAFMADVYGRLTGQAGVCLSTLGPGAANLVTGVANANMDNAPVVAITGQGATTRLHKESHQAMNVNEMFAPLTKWTTSLRDESTIPEVVRKAFKLAVAEKPGATHVELPEDIAKHEVESAPIVPPEKVRRPVPDDKSISAALDLIARAERPVLLVGQGCVRTRVSRQLQRFVEATGIYAGMTFMGKGALSDRHERSLYAVGLGSRDYVTEVFEASDLVIAVGYDMVEWPPSHWNIGRTKRLLHIDFDPAEVDMSYRPTVEIVGDVAATLWAINEGLTDAHRFPDFEGHARARRNLTEEITEAGASAERETGDFPMKPQRVLADLRAEMDDEDILISDVGAHKMWIARHYPTYAPNTCIISNGFCSMGIAVPGSVSASLVAGDRRVVAISGDGGFLMHGPELATATRLGVAPVNLVWEDNDYGLISWKQEIEFGRHFGTEFKTPDLVKISEGLGCHARRLGSADELRPALKEAFDQRDKPSVIVVPVDYSENVKLTKRLGQLIAR
ncbi:acetolactate synthase large subunit [Actinomycetospora cinnamomea]|uniref:Acetolactate synthase-1/2/3 large subunit n=1 Tax=Actinomycetospora cinnamomea TaxID=663609 RepID=A0A2U1F889_9PSEU|nr:acetolactate synthase large subunit [Actinomycetospora cinnamomea]PVZ08413.1 acetolactate synthase-1/2/3 large subunit [Actinomycetospora cinnamomea]